MYHGRLETYIFQGMDCVSRVLNFVLKVGFLGILRGMVVRAILIGGCSIFFRGRRVYFAKYKMC